MVKNFANNSVLTYDHTNDKLVVGKALDSAGVIKNNIFDSYDNLNDIVFKHNGTDILTYNKQSMDNFIFNRNLITNSLLTMPLNSKLEFQHTNSYIRETLDSGNFINYVLLPSTGITTQEHRFCVNGETTNALVMTNDENGVNFLKATTGLNTGVPSSINVNNLDTTGDVDMVFERNNVEFFRLDSVNSILNVAIAIGVSTSNLYANLREEGVNER